MKFTISLLLILLPVIAVAQLLVEGNGKDSLVIRRDNYTLRINCRALAIDVLKGEQVISATRGFSFRDGDKTVNLTSIENWKVNGNSLILNCETSDAGSQALISLELLPDNIEMRLEIPDYRQIRDLMVSFDVKAGKHWYGGHITSGHQWPLEKSQIVFDPLLAHSNQATPFWLTASGVGYYLPSYELIGFRLNDKNSGLFELFMKDSNELDLHLKIGKDIRDAYRLFMKEAGLPKTVPPEGFFMKPVFNSWIEYMQNINQDKILDYARKIRKHDIPCEVMMIDAGWFPIHGHYDFDRKKFPDPKAMIDELHRMDFKLMIWVSPYVRIGSPHFEFLDSSGYLIRDENGKKPGTIKWWGGTDYEIDMSNPSAFNWYRKQLRNLQITYGVDGFKQDGGDAKYIPPGYNTFKDVPPNLSTDYWAKIGTYFDYNEYRVSWMMQQAGLVQRLRDKHNTWTIESGLGSLVPHGMTSSLIGYSYFCPDMIGGGDAKDFRDPGYKGMGTELFIRWTEASAMMPMMQFSYAPWNLDEHALKICIRYAKLHNQLGPYICNLASETTRTGDPIVRPLFYDNPGDEKTYLIGDEFMLGDRFLVAPVQQQGAVKRDVYLPAGLWKDFWSGAIYEGGKTIKDFPAPLEVLPLFIRIN